MAGRLPVWLCLAALAGGCSPEALPYRNPVDRFVVHFNLERTLHYWPCSAGREYSNGFVIQRTLPSDRCYRFDPPRRMRGIFVPAQEASDFLPDAVRAPVLWDIEDEHMAFLEADWDKVGDSLPQPPKGESDSFAYALEFIGRQSTYPGEYGGMTAHPHLIILDRLISARIVPGPGRYRDMDDLAEEAFRRNGLEDQAARKVRSPFLSDMYRRLTAVRPDRLDLTPEESGEAAAN